MKVLTQSWEIMKSDLVLQMVNSKVTKGKRMRDAESYRRKEMKDHVFSLLESGFNFGDITWVRSDSNSWWPAQLLNEKGVTPSNKPRKKAESEFLVRLYGTYNYMYIDPVKNNKEFENTLKQNNSSISEMLLKTLEKDLSCLELHCKTRRKSGGSSESMSVSANTEMLVKAERNGKTDPAVSVRTCMDKDDAEGLKNGNINSEMKNPKQYYTRRQNHTRVGRDGTLEHVKPDVNDGCGVSCTSDTEKIDRTNPLGLKLKKREIRKQPFTSKITDGALLNRKQGVKREWLKKETGSTVMHRGEKEELCPEVIKQEEVKEQNVMKEAKHALIARKHRHEEKSLSAIRRTKVMQKLALIAPSGSPFLKN